MIMYSRYIVGDYIIMILYIVVFRFNVAQKTTGYGSKPCMPILGGSGQNCFMVHYGV